jgi:membrane-bound acyltransferase YfiQ involved in biofilm formation
MARRLLILNGIAILGVILFHTTGFGFVAMFFWPHRYRPVTSPNFDAAGGAAYYELRLVEQAFASFCIPAFIFVAGYSAAVLAGRSRTGLTTRAISSRVQRLVWPYLLWSGLVLAALAIQGRVYAPGRYVRMLLTGAANPNYYFIPMLIQLYVLAPLAVRAASWNWRALLAVTALVQAGIYLLQYGAVLGAPGSTWEWLAYAVPKWLFVTHVFWFCAGLVAGLEQQAFGRFLQRTRAWWPIAAAVLFAVGVVEWEWLLGVAGTHWRENRSTLVDGLYGGAALLAIVAHGDAFRSAERWLSELGARSFGIYLAHGVVMEYTARALYHAAPWVLGIQPAFQTLLIVLGLFVPLAMMEALKRSRAAAVYPYVFG